MVMVGVVVLGWQVQVVRRIGCIRGWRGRCRVGRTGRRILVFTFFALAFGTFEELPNGGRYFLL